MRGSLEQNDNDKTTSDDEEDNSTGVNDFIVGEGIICETPPNHKHIQMCVPPLTGQFQLQGKRIQIATMNTTVEQDCKREFVVWPI